MIRAALLHASLLAATLVVACGGGGSSATSGGATTPPTYAASSGVAQKGPLVAGSSVIAQELSAGLVPAGNQYAYQITSDLGTFQPGSVFASPYIDVSATGNYFDEVANAVSDGPISLNAVSDLSADNVLNVNILTTLAYQRIKNLVASASMTVSAARAQAEAEVLAALNVHSAVSRGSFGTLDLASGSDGGHLLAAVSSLFAYGNSSTSLGTLLAAAQSDLGAHGALTNPATVAVLAAAAKAINPAVIAANLSQAYAAAGVSFTASDIADWIDQDGDGLIGKFKYQATNAGATSVFTFLTTLTDAFVGTPISATAGQLSINGTPVSGSAVTRKGDVIAVSPGATAFANGTLVTYLLSATTKVGRVSFFDALVSITVGPPNPTVPKGVSQQFTAVGTFSDGSTADLTHNVLWACSAPGTVAIGGPSGVGLAQAVGSATISASLGGVAGSIAVAVAPAVVQSIAVVPSPFATGVGIARQLTVIGNYSDGSTADLTASATWVSQTPTVAFVTGGLATGVALGTTTVGASLAGLSSSTVLSVTSNAINAASVAPNIIANGATALLANGKILLTGGTDPNGSSSASVSIYDPVLDRWSAAASMANARAYYSAITLPNGKVLVIGGYQAFEATFPFVPNTELYDPASDSWSPAASSPSSQGYIGAILLQNGKVLALGGGHPVSGSDLYDPAADTWTPAGTMVIPRSTYTATLLGNGKVLVAGGTSPDYLSITNCELYDPGSNTWAAAGSLANPRDADVAVLLPNGKVLVAGGEALPGQTVNTPPVVYASAEIYDPASDSWSLAASMATPSTLDTAVLLSNGKVLVEGGIAQLYDPAADAWLSAPLAFPDAFGSPVTGIALPNGSTFLLTGSTVSLYW